MEEILASIRRIISEEDVPADKGDDLPVPPPEPEPQAAVASAFAAPEREPEAEPEPQPEPVAFAADEDDDEVLELTERVESVGDIDAYSPTTAPAFEEPVSAAYEEPAPALAPAPAPVDVGEGLVGPEAASLAASAFTRLSANIGLGNGDATLEQIVRELLRPLLKQWLDDNLPGIVQTAVEAEVERIARGRVR
jgi:hypothetical protein